MEGEAGRHALYRPYVYNQSKQIMKPAAVESAIFQNYPPIKVPSSGVARLNNRAYCRQLQAKFLPKTAPLVHWRPLIGSIP